MTMMGNVEVDQNEAMCPPGARLGGRGDLELFHVRNSWDHEAFRAYIENAAALLPNVKTQADIARLTNVKPSLLSKWFRGQEQPSTPSLEKICDGFVASGVQVDINDLMALSGRLPRGAAEAGDGQRPTPPTATIGHRLAREIDAMLADSSPLPADKRTVLEEFIDQMLETYRPLMRRRRPA